MKESDIIQNIKSKFGIESINAMQRTMADEFRRQDIMLLSPTGSGKTIAFAIYLIKNLKEPCGRVQAVVIAPSRELTVQIYKVMQAISSEYKTTCCYGGHNFEDEKNSLNATPDIIISTPGRLLDHLTRGDIDIRPVRILILDEFDKSLELGFQDEMRKIFAACPQAIDNTQVIADQCDVEFEFGTLHLPEFVAPDGKDNKSYLRELCEKGLSERYPNGGSELKERLDYELSIIEQMGYVEYFLIVWDFINYAREQGIVVGPGRGSAAGSIVAYTLHITDIDPIKYNLIFHF